MTSLDDEPVEPAAGEPWPPLYTADLIPTGSAAPALSSLALVLTARGIPCRIVAGRLLLPAREHALARREIHLYLRENRPAPAPPAFDGAYANGRITLALLLLLGIFHNLTLLVGPRSAWLERGNAEAGRILAGEWWRAVTALTLHSDALHLAGNLLIGGYFVYRLCRMLGGGLGWSLILASGTAGNVLNALIQAPDHRSVGASTALFGAIGAAGMLGVWRRPSGTGRRWLLPLAGAAGLLAILGAGDADGAALTDIGAHLCGFLCGLGLGHCAGRQILHHGLPAPRLNRLLGLLAAVLPLLAWSLAWQG